jgi:hypothetical protein
MTEADWLEWTNPESLMFELEGLARSGAVRLSDRRLWLYMAACVRRVWHLLPNEQYREGVLTAERFADCRVDAGEFARIAEQVNTLATLEEERGALSEPFGEAWSPACAACAVAFLLTEVPRGWEARTATGWAADAVADRRWLDEPEGKLRWQQAKAQEEAAQAKLLRDIFANPFHRTTFQATWRTSTVNALALAAYEERHMPSGQFDTVGLGILADALEEAGCDNADLLGHLRGPGPHVRGCWAVDLAAAKE